MFIGHERERLLVLLVLFTFVAAAFVALKPSRDVSDFLMLLLLPVFPTALPASDGSAAAAAAAVQAL